MPVHDWTRVDAGIYHHFHVAWIPEIAKVLNGGLLPEGYYALAEQHAGRTVPDLLTLQLTVSNGDDFPARAPSGTAVAEAPPKVRWHLRMEPDSLHRRRRTLAIRHVTGHRLIAIIELVSPSNKDRSEHVDQFVDKVLSALKAGIHVLVIDPFPPGRSDPQGIHGAIQGRLNADENPPDLPASEPLTLVSYVGGADVEGYLEHARVGAALPDMPLFFCSERYINVPLESTYLAAYAGMPAYWRKVLEEA